MALLKRGPTRELPTGHDPAPDDCGDGFFGGLFAPPSCAVCGEAGYRGLCPDCRSEMEELFDPRPFLCREGNGFADGAFALFRYASPMVRRLLFDLKRNGFRDSVDLFGAFVRRQVLPEEILSADLVTFCPRTLKARGERGFDQSLLLAEKVSEVLGIPAERLLLRSRPARAQHALSSEDRRKNVTGTFSAARPLSSRTRSTRSPALK